MAVFVHVTSTAAFSLTRVCALIALCALPSAAAQFDLTMLIRYGQNGNGGNSWELGLGPNSSSLTTAGINPNWNNGVSREFQLAYTASSNSVQLRLFANGSNSNPDVVNYNLSGPGGTSNTTWTLPATAFFASATPSPQGFVAISVSGLNIVSPTGGAINVIQPFASTSMNANSNNAATISQSQDIVFKADANGNWRLGGFITLNFSNSNGGPPPDGIQFGANASGGAVPEPSTWVTMSLGLAAIGWKSRRKLWKQRA